MTNMELEAIRHRDILTLLDNVRRAAHELGTDLEVGRFEADTVLHAALGLAEGFLAQVQLLLGLPRPDPA